MRTIKTANSDTFHAVNVGKVALYYFSFSQKERKTSSEEMNADTLLEMLWCCSDCVKIVEFTTTQKLYTYLNNIHT